MDAAVLIWTSLINNCSIPQRPGTVTSYTACQFLSCPQKELKIHMEGLNLVPYYAIMIRAFQYYISTQLIILCWNRIRMMILMMIMSSSSSIYDHHNDMLDTRSVSY